MVGSRNCVTAAVDVLDTMLGEMHALNECSVVFFLQDDPPERRGGAETVRSSRRVVYPVVGW